MRVFARIVTLMLVVVGASLALAWAWDHSDQQQATPPQQQPTQP